ncbi:MAG: hypothetical protein EZS28_004233 [Streblomastix strix]|uniref:Uncharacterized protein n=1 Tax=Streblomastix strix TaxID=222440 RepID=A0A5J4WZD2_9EUKA|nr:MAG: hypothetical protein EZS28_004233 [Streblomastix strix]
MTDSDISLRGISSTNPSESMRIQVLSSGEKKSQIVQHAHRLLLPEISDAAKIQSLESLVILSFRLQHSEIKEILCSSGIIQSVSSLIFETDNPRIRTLCDAILHILHQIGTESESQVDWKTFLQLLIEFLFNEDERISDLGKQALLDAIKRQPHTISYRNESETFDAFGFKWNILLVHKIEKGYYQQQELQGIFLVLKSIDEHGEEFSQKFKFQILIHQEKQDPVVIEIKHTFNQLAPDQGTWYKLKPQCLKEGSGFVKNGKLRVTVILFL